MRGRVLVVAGSDSGGGAGIQADIKTVMALGGYAMTAVTALTAQDTRGVHGVMPVPPDFVQLQMRVVLDDIGADAIKTGMLGDAALIAAIVAVLRQGDVPLVVDPVMVAKGGASLLGEGAVAAMRAHLFPRAAVIIPNIPEAEVLVGYRIATEAQMRAAAAELVGQGVAAVLLKGGHLDGEEVVDLLATPDGITAFRSERIHSTHTHGTGCTLASAVATGLAQGLSLLASVERARAYVRAAILAAPGFGHGHGPLGHGLFGHRLLGHGLQTKIL